MARYKSKVKAHTLRKYIDKHYDETLYTVMEAADIVGKSPETLRRWRNTGAVNAPTAEIQVGSRSIPVYTNDDIKELKAYAKVVHPGRPRKE